MSELVSAIEAIVYAAEEPATAAQMAAVLGVDKAVVEEGLAALGARYASDDYGVELRAVAGGYRMATKPQHHEAVRQFLKSLKPRVRLSLAALETLAVIAYRQPVTLPEIRDIRGVDPAGVINTLLEKKLVTTAGRKEALGKPILYRTTREFLVQFGLSGLRDLPTLKEFEEMAQAGLEGLEPAAAVEAGAAAISAEPTEAADATLLPAGEGERG
ncbi:MAG TPA: SMC-Scp complex subunit ScpB [Terriglobales bacterium]|nr:SMC-Scp complex subunit ScpB [Terriglobales bacterium]